MLNLLLESKIPYDRLFTSDEQVYLILSARNFKRFSRLCEERGLPISVSSEKGFPVLWRRYAGRFGMWLGLLTAAVLIYASSQVVWDVRVFGNASLDDQAIVDMLRENGFGVGTYLKSFDKDEIETRLLLSHREIAWISINVKGTTAHVEVKETVRGDRAEGTATDLVAAREGKIERIEAYDGNVCVKVGDVVRRGEVLVSGLYEDKGALRTAEAKGKIFARTFHTFEVEICLETTEKVYTDREWKEKYINFFSKRIKVFTNTGKMGGDCDIISYHNHFTMPGGVSLPIGIETVCFREFEERTLSLTDEEAMQKAFSALEAEIGDFVTQTGAELRRKTVECELTEDAYRIRCTVECVENIAEAKKIEIN